jgi:acyl-CoA reductase-like NAD-dependent aldehyde dehydrogenase/uncharacterized protein (DUF2141 family)
MQRARRAQAQWVRLTTAQRAQPLRRLRYSIARRMDEIVQVISDEIGKPAMDVLAGDVMVTLELLRFYEREAARVLKPVKRGKPWFFYSGTRFVEITEPHGVVLVFAPWNYPLQLAMVPAATALFAGNAVLLKCSELAPRTSQLIEELCADAELPEDLVQVSCELPEEATALLDCRPDFVFFTGSSLNGRLVAVKAASLMIPTAMELGGKDAALVFNSCNLERATNGLAYGGFSNAGQVCAGTKRIFVQQSIYDRFLREFVEKVSRLRVGTNTESDIGSVRFERVRERLRDQVEEAIQAGAQVHTPWPWDQDIAAPVVLTNVAADAALLQEETFGPVVCIAPFNAEEDAIEMANSSPFALSATVWTADDAQGKRVALRLQCGSSSINDVIRSIGNPEAAFGGNKSSGYGRYHGVEGLRTFSRVKTVMATADRRRTEVHWFPFRAETFARFRGLLELRHSGTIADRIKAFTKLLALSLLLSCFSSFAQPAHSQESDGSLILNVTLPPHAHGEIAYLVFATADGFPDRTGSAVRHNFIPLADPDAGLQRIDLGPLPPGRYAVSVYLDENGNHQLDKNWIGIPKEPVGASNNPKGSMGPPHFDECSFAHGKTAETIPITLTRCCQP